MAQPSKRSKQQDQKWIAKDELSRQERAAFKRALREAESIFRIELQDSQAVRDSRTWQRLAATARRDERGYSPLVYAALVLLK